MQDKMNLICINSIKNALNFNLLQTKDCFFANFIIVGNTSDLILF